jgi:hypothetical protein
MSLGLDDNDDKRAFCRKTWLDVMGRELDTQATLDMCMGVLTTHGSDALVGFLQTSPEGIDVIDHRRKRDGLLPVKRK